MLVKTVTPNLSVAPQILPGDIAAIKAMGFASVICNRPDGECTDQPTFAEIQRQAQKSGILCQYQPIVSGNLTPADAETFADAIRTLPGPILAYCRTGTRSISLWALSAAKDLGDEAVLKLSQRAGYDLSTLIARFPHHS